MGQHLGHSTPPPFIFMKQPIHFLLILYHHKINCNIIHFISILVKSSNWPHEFLSVFCKSIGTIVNSICIPKLVSISVNVFIKQLLYCQPSVTVMSGFVYKVIRVLESMNHLCINPIHHRIGLIHR